MQKWSSVKIGDLGKVLTGRTPPIKDVAYFGTKYPFITPTDMHSGKIVHTTERYLSEKGANLLKNNYLPPRSICVSCIGWQMGKTVMTAYPSFTNQQINTIIPKTNVDPDFLYYALTPKRNELLSLGASTGVRTPILNKSAFSALEIVLPPLKIQKKIAYILSAYDDLIENNIRRIKILEEMAQMLYREWFVNFRFPNHENVKMVESALGLMPEGWETVKLGNHITTQKGYAFKSEWYQDYGVPIVKVSNFTDNSIDITNLVSISEEIAQQYKKYELKSNEIIIQTVGSWASNPQSVVGKVIRTPREAKGALLNQNAVKIFPQNSINLAFLFYCLKREEFKSYIVGCGQGAASQASITLDAIKAFEILLPSSNLLELFKKTIYTNWELINNLGVKNINLRKTRDLLLPKLISGEIDVEKLDIETLEIAA